MYWLQFHRSKNLLSRKRHGQLSILNPASLEIRQLLRCIAQIYHFLPRNDDEQDGTLSAEIQIAATSLFLSFVLSDFLLLSLSLSLPVAVLPGWTYLWSCVSVRERQADTVRNYYLRKVLLDCCGWTGLSKGHTPASDWKDIRWVTYQSDSLLSRFLFSFFFFHTSQSALTKNHLAQLSASQAQFPVPPADDFA